MGLVDNFMLGVSGVADLVSRADDALIKAVGYEDSWVGSLAKGNNTQLAAAEYAEQVAAGGDTASKYLDGVRDRDGAEAASKLAESAAQGAVKAGALGAAAKNTAETIAQKVGKVADDAGGVLSLLGNKWFVGAAVLVGAGVAAWRIVR